MTHHTPGPWIVCDGNDLDPFVVMEDGQRVPDRGAIASVVYGDRHLSEATENARLIAAAPDLLEAAKASLAAIASRRRLADGEPEFVEMSLRAAIEKATGREA